MIRVGLPDPLGAVTVEWDDQGVTRVVFAEGGGTGEEDPHGARRALLAWAGGAVHALEAVPVSMSGTPFQESVWRALRGVRAGTNVTYGSLAALLGRPTAVRAVARANASNPIALFVPCHRVIGADGRLVGYAGGLWRKRWLLAHEGAPGFLVP